MNVELANYLLNLDKFIVENNIFIEDKQLKIESPVNLRFVLGSKGDADQSFLVDIKESDKKALKIDFHHQDDRTKHGLLRVDYYSRHKNPVELLDTLPNKFKPFAGIYLDGHAGHIHYIVDGYLPLAWAIPLESDDFPIKNINNVNDITSVLKAFFEKINLKTDLQYSSQKRML